MKRIAKLILWIVGGLLGIVVLALIAINVYLQSGDVQNRIRLATEQAIGNPITVHRTLFTPWSGLILSGLGMPDPLNPGTDMVKAPSFCVKFELLPLLQKKFVVSEISLNSPQIELRQNDEGNWVLTPETRQPRPEGREPRPTHEPRPAQRPPDFTVELNKFRLVDGGGSFYDRKGRRIAWFSGLDIEGTISPDQSVTGDIRIREMEFAGQLHPRRLRADFERKEQNLSVTNIKCALAGGSIRGEFFALLPKRGGKAQIAFKSSIEDVSIPQLIEEAHCNAEGTTGTLEGQFRIEGNPIEQKSLVGDGRFDLKDAQIRPIDVIRQFGTLFKIDELQMLALKQAELQFGIRDEKVWIENLTLKTENLVLSGTGPVKFNGKMDIDGRFMVNEKLQEQLAGILSDNFEPSEDANYKQVSFDVTGRIDRPQSNFIERVTGINLGPVGGLIRGFLGTPKSSGDDKKPDASKKQ